MHLSVRVGQQVEDQTGIQGYFGLNLEVPDSVGGTVGQGAASAPSGRSIETAIGDDLNLALVGGKIAVPIVNIEHVERPTPD